MNLKEERTSNELVIQGILKEALYLENDFILNSENSLCRFKLMTIIEQGIRDSSASKRLYFALLTPALQLVAGQAYSLKSQFPRCNFVGDFEFEGIVEQQYVFRVPSHITLTNLRKSDRAILRTEFRGPISVFLCNASLHSEAALAVKDVSADGFGGKLWVPTGFVINSNTELSGSFDRGGPLAEIRGRITSARMLPSDRPGFDLYVVGVQQERLLRRPISKDKESRSQKRFHSNFQIQLESALFPGQWLILDVDDVSINGFSGKPSTDSVNSAVPVGSIFTIKGEKTIVQLVHFNESRYHFNIKRRSTEDGIAWLRKMTPIVHPHARCTTKDAREMYRIFLQAGAISAQYLKRHQLHRDLLVGLHADSREATYLHRWFIGGTKDAADAYLSALRIGNTSWCIGDVAKVDGANIGAQGAVRAFFRSFGEFAMSNVAIGSVMAVWVKGHPYWQNWLNALRNENPTSICAEGRMNYFRIDGKPRHSEYGVVIERLCKEDYSKRRILTARLGGNVEKMLTYAFDWNEIGVASFFFEAECPWFARTFLRIKTDRSEYVGHIVNRASPGVSLNRFLDSLFLVPVEQSGHTESSMNAEIQEIAFAVAREMHLAIPSVRVIHESDQFGAGTPMTALLIYPNGLSKF